MAVSTIRHKGEGGPAPIAGDPSVSYVFGKASRFDRLGFDASVPSANS
jgi:hypothetical protein